jgi:hypothetical protein
MTAETTIASLRDLLLDGGAMKAAKEAEKIKIPFAFPLAVDPEETPEIENILSHAVEEISPEKLVELICRSQKIDLILRVLEATSRVRKLRPFSIVLMEAFANQKKSALTEYCEQHYLSAWRIAEWLQKYEPDSLKTFAILLAEHGRASQVYDFFKVLSPKKNRMTKAVYARLVLRFVTRIRRARYLLPEQCNEAKDIWLKYGPYLSSRSRNALRGVFEGRLYE